MMDYQKFLNELLENLISEDGSDLHLGVGRKPAIRINGQLVLLVNQEVMKEADIFGVLNALVGPERVKKFKETKDIDFSSNLNNGQIQISGNAFVQRGIAFIPIPVVSKANTFL